jgi:hypothetical protein
MLKAVVALAQEPLERGAHWTKRKLQYALPAYFTAVDAAADPAIADILLKVYANDEFLSMDAAFRPHLPQEKYLAWLEGIAMGLKDFNARRYVLEAWSKAGPSARSSLQRVAGAMTGADPARLGGDTKRQAEFRKEIEVLLGRMEAP